MSEISDGPGTRLRPRSQNVTMEEIPQGQDCNICGLTNKKKLIECTTCSNNFHLSCLRPRLSSTQAARISRWECAECQTSVSIPDPGDPHRTAACRSPSPESRDPARDTSLNPEHEPGAPVPLSAPGPMDPPAASNPHVERNRRCHTCSEIRPLKKMVGCVECNMWSHQSCVGLSRRQAAEIPHWMCPSCRGVQATQTEPTQSLFSLDLMTALLERRKLHRTIQFIPKGDRTAAAEAFECCGCNQFEKGLDPPNMLSIMGPLLPSIGR